MNVDDFAQASHRRISLNGCDNVKPLPTSTHLASILFSRSLPLVGWLHASARQPAFNRTLIAVFAYASCS
jgi:hypothetical protein